MVERVNSSIIYLIYCRNFCKCHNVPPPSTIIIIIIIIIIKTSLGCIQISSNTLGALLNKIGLLEHINSDDTTTSHLITKISDWWASNVYTVDTLHKRGFVSQVEQRRMA
jgi:hypothetical protein